VLAFQNGLDDCNADGHINNGDDPCTSDKSLVNICPVTPEFTRLNCVQQASISTWFNLAMFTAAVSTRVCFTAIIRGDTAMLSRLHPRLCHAFVVSLFSS